MIQRVVVVGGGNAGLRHVAVARQLLPEADIRVVRRDPGAGVPAGANGLLSSPAEAADFRPQVAAVANPAPFHVPVGLTLLESGAHLLVEKPLSTTAKAAIRLAEAADRCDRLVLVGYNLRYSESLRSFKQLVDAGRAGQPLYVRSEVGQYLPDWRPDTDYRQGVTARRELGGGALLELSHELDYLRWCFGEVRAASGTLLSPGSLGIDVEEVVHLVLEFDRVHEGAPSTASVTMDLVRRDPVRQCLMVGRTGSLRWDGRGGTVEYFDSQVGAWEEIFRDPYPLSNTYIEQWRHFIRCVEGAEAPNVSVQDGVKVMRIIEAARSASDSGCRQIVPREPTL